MLLSFSVTGSVTIAKSNAAVYEIGISYYGRSKEEGKKIGFKDGVAALFYILKYNWLTDLKSSYREIPQKSLVESKHFIELETNE